MSFLGLLILDECEDLLSIDVVLALSDDCVADLTNQNHEARRSVVVR